VAVRVCEPLARELPGRSVVRASPHARAVPLARGGRVDGARFVVAHGVVDRPALAERAANLPVAPIAVALEHEQPLARSDEQNGLRHASHLRSGTLSWSLTLGPAPDPELIGHIWTTFPGAG